MKQITDFEIIDHGFVRPRMISCTFTEYDFVTLGEGDDPNEALYHIGQQLMIAGFDISEFYNRIKKKYNLKSIPTSPVGNYYLEFRWR